MVEGCGPPCVLHLLIDFAARDSCWTFSAARPFNRERRERNVLCLFLILKNEREESKGKISKKKESFQGKSLNIDLIDVLETSVSIKIRSIGIKSHPLVSCHGWPKYKFLRRRTAFSRLKRKKTPADGRENKSKENNKRIKYQNQGQFELEVFELLQRPQLLEDHLDRLSAFQPLPTEDGFWL